MQTPPIEIGDIEPSTAEQRQARALETPSGPNWASRLDAQKTVVARKAGLPVGFMTLDSDGYIVLAFVKPDHQRQGIGGSLYARIEALAREARMTRVHSQVSYLDRGLFEQQGWEVVREQQNERGGVT